VAQLSTVHARFVFGDRCAEPVSECRDKHRKPSEQNVLGCTACIVSAAKGHLVQDEASTEDGQDKTDGCSYREARALGHVVLFVLC